MRRAHFKNNWIAALMVAPQLIIVFTFFYFPTSQALYWAFTLEQPWGGGNTWVGFDNFTATLSDPLYWSSIWVSAVYAVGSTALAVGMALMLAIFADRQLAGYRAYKIGMIWPYAIAAPAVGLAFRFIFSPGAGIMMFVNDLFPHLWNPVESGNQAMAMVIVAGAWKQVAYNFIFFLAGLQSIPRTPILNIATHAILAFGLILLLLPMYLVVVAASHSLQDVVAVPPNLLPGDQLWINLQEAWAKGHLGQRFVTTFVAAMGVMSGKIILSCITAFGIVFFDHRLKMPIFWLIFITLMLPLEVRIVPTYAVAANAFLPFQTLLDLSGITWVINALSGIQVKLEWNPLNSYAGLIMPLVATATGTFLYRQFFLTIPEELVEAAKMDGAGPLRFLWDVLIPLSRTNIAALATIMFVYAWNQYLWPLLVVTDQSYAMIAGLESITSGQISIADKVVNDLEPHERGCAMVFQNYALYPHMTVAENIGYRLKVAGLPKAERAAKVAAVAASVGLMEYLDRRPGQLSGGQRQRVAMARAIVWEPAVFLFDEPLSNLDAKLRVQMRHEIRRIHNQIGATSVFVTHDPAEGMTLADRLLVMNKGVIEQVGTPEDIYNHPASVYVGGFIGSPAMNFLSGEVSGKMRAVVLADGSRIDLPAPLAAAHDGKLTQIGLRPEALALVPAGKGAFDAVLEFAEELGPARLYHFRFEYLMQSVLSADKPPVQVGQPMSIKIAPGAVHLFAADSGKRLGAREAAMELVLA